MYELKDDVFNFVFNWVPNAAICVDTEEVYVWNEDVNNLVFISFCNVLADALNWVSVAYPLSNAAIDALNPNVVTATDEERLLMLSCNVLALALNCVSVAKVVSNELLNCCSDAIDCDCAKSVTATDALKADTEALTCASVAYCASNEELQLCKEAIELLYEVFLTFWEEV